jgi:hypothetical protein
MTIEQHALAIKEKEKSLGIPGDLIRIADPAIKQTSAVQGTSILQEYANRELYFNVDSVPRAVEIGLAKMQEYFNLQDNGKPTWVITENCVNFIAELEQLHFKTWASKKSEYENNPHEKIQSKDDHAFDSARYFATALPDLAPLPQDVKVRRPDPAELVKYDQALLAESRRKEEEGSVWTVIETY